MPTRKFAVTWDYRCPFARNAHEHVLAGLAGGADWDVTFVPFSLGQVHVAEGEAPIWDRPDDDTGLLALRAGTIVRDRFPEEFPAVHRSLFAARHDDGLALKDHEVVASTIAKHLGADRAAEVVEAAGGAEALATVRAAHETAAADQSVWGVPTFVAGAAAVFVRLMDRNPGESAEDRERGRVAVERVLDLLEWPELNEYKHTSIPR
ncbi:MAG: protein-disulfide isomerase [Acidimicrobiia bacterium]|nr:protein-disulfide isomerase [Acidimicrobiia bacterium]